MHEARRQHATPWLCGLVLLLFAASPAPPGGPGARELERAEARARVERDMLRALVRQHRRAADESWRDRLVDVIHDEATIAGIDPLLVGAIVARESSFRSRVVSRAGAVGLMQLRPWVARDLAERAELDWRDGETLWQPESNVRLGVSYYRELVRRFGGDAELALAAYHRGPTRLAREMRAGSFSESRYARSVLELYQRLDARRQRALGEG